MTASLLASLALALTFAQPAVEPKKETPKPETPAPAPAPAADKPDPTKAANWPFESAAPEQVAKGYSFTEGPTWVRTGENKGFFIFCDAGANIVYSYDNTEAKPVALREETKKAIGSTADAKGTIFQVEAADRSILSWSVADGKASKPVVVADKFNGKKLGGMNDLAVHSSGALYITNATWFIDPASVEFKHSGVLRVAKDGTVSIAADGLNGPNGICFSPDEKTCYVTEYGAGKINAFTVAADGSLTDKKLFADLSAMAKDKELKGRGGADGIRCDTAGNVFSTGPAGIWVLNSKGEFIAHLPARGTNLAFGGTDMKTLLITTGSGIAKIRVKTPGR